MVKQASAVVERFFALATTVPQQGCREVGSDLTQFHRGIRHQDEQISDVIGLVFNRFLDRLQPCGADAATDAEILTDAHERGPDGIRCIPVGAQDRRLLVRKRPPPALKDHRFTQNVRLDWGDASARAGQGVVQRPADRLRVAGPVKPHRLSFDPDHRVGLVVRQPAPQRCQRGEVGGEVGAVFLQPVPQPDGPHPFQLALRQLEGELVRSQREGRPDAHARRQQPRHRQEQRLAAPGQLGQPRVEHRHQARLFAFRTAVGGGEDRAPLRRVAQRRHGVRLRPVQQCGDGGRIVAAPAERLRPPALTRGRVPLQQQQAEPWPAVVQPGFVVGQFNEPVVQRRRERCGVIEHDQRRRIPAPRRQICLRAEPVHLEARDKAGAPIRRGKRPARLQHQARLAPSAAPGEHAHRDWRGTVQPSGQPSKLGATTDEGDGFRVAAEEIGFTLAGRCKTVAARLA